MDAVPANLAKALPTAKPDSRFHHQPGSEPSPSAADLLDWYSRHARRLPWRTGPAERRQGKRPDPYRVWLSEVMLQQTNVKAAAPYYQRFLARWPTLADLSAAPEAEVMAAWAGLGYYSRARNLVACAAAVSERPGSRFPQTSAELQSLPGIGAYTSASIAAIAFGERVAAVDGNVERVIARVFSIATPLPAAKLIIRSLLQPIVPPERSGEFAEALMDLGATICTPKRPACALCPWSAPCTARRDGRQAEFPRKAAKKPRPLRFGDAYVARRADGAILLRRRPPRGLLGGMAEVPGTDWAEAGKQAPAFPVASRWTAIGSPVRHAFTHFELQLAVHRAEVGQDAPTPEGHWWAASHTLSEEALPNVMKKAIEAAYPGATRPAGRAPGAV